MQDASGLPGVPVDALVLLVGPAGAGKSTWARGRFRRSQVVSSDDLREMVSDDATDQDATRDAFAILHAIGIWNELVLPTKTHVVDRNLELLGPLGIHDPQVRFDLPVAAADAQTADRIIVGLGLGQFAMINPGAGWPSKLWPTDRYAAVARHLSAKHELPALVVWANPAERQMAEILDEARSQWPDAEVAAVHRTGRLEIGEVSVAIAASSPHRVEAFAACRFVIDAIKQRVPIWKKEVAEDGEEWIEGE